MSTYEIIGLILGGGGFGSFITWLIQLKSQKRIVDAQANSAENEAKHSKEKNALDSFDAATSQINKLIKDYNELDDNYREYRKKSAEEERQFSDIIRNKCAELAKLSSQVAYLKELRCYNTTCPHRIKTNPDKLK